MSKSSGIPKRIGKIILYNKTPCILKDCGAKLSGDYPFVIHVKCLDGKKASWSLSKDVKEIELTSGNCIALIEEESYEERI